MRRSTEIQLGALTALAVLGTALGWRALWFLTDDAFIAFRYVSNAQLGHGFTWNPPPFLPVEGYTSFLWVGMLDLCWSIAGLEPPVAANLLALTASIATVLLTAWASRRLWQRSRPPLPATLGVGLVLALLVSNSTFLTWSSSGLETALFDLLLLAWLLGLWLLAAHPRLLPAVAAVAALLELCRPDGLLFAAATLLVPAALWLGERPRPRAPLRWLAGLLPLLAIPAHLLWRHGFYGAWLPNTYYAKVVEPWPAAGWRYLLSFVLEHALWLWALLLGAALLRRLWLPAPASTPRELARPWLLGLAGAALLAHTGYYVLIVGGDHFEYRVLAHWVPLLALGFGWALFQLRLRPAPALLLGALFLLGTNLLPWSLWWHSRPFTTRGETHMLVLPLAPRLPGPVASYARRWDGLQRWLIDRYVCVRRQEHAVFQQFQASYLPSRDDGALAFPGVRNPVITSPSVGVLGWVYPHAAIIDMLGLNDWVAARTPMNHDRGRVMAHDREVPAGYVTELMPVLYTREGKLHPRERERELTDERVREIERIWRAQVAE